MNRWIDEFMHQMINQEVKNQTVNELTNPSINQLINKWMIRQTKLFESLYQWINAARINEKVTMNQGINQSIN